MKLWVTADSTYITEVSNAVSGWDDRTANAFDLSQGTAANKPTWVPAGWNGTKGVVRTDRGSGTSTRKWLSSDGTALSDVLDGDDAPFGVIIVGQHVSTATLDTLVSWGNSGSSTNILALGLETGSSQIGGFKRVGADTVNIDGSTASDTSRHVLLYTGDTHVDAYRDATQTLTNVDISAVGAQDPNQFTLGAFRRSGIDEGSNFDFREVVVVNRRITVAEFTAARTYAAATHGGLTAP